MADRRLQSRLARLESKAQTHFNTQQTTYKFPKSRNRKEKLAIALSHLERGGVTGSYAYAPFFQICAHVGIIIKPLHYRSWGGLIMFFMALWVFITTTTIFVSGFFGVMPRPVRGLIDAGPVVFLIGALVLSVIFAGIHKAKANQIGLPRWRDI